MDTLARRETPALLSKTQRGMNRTVPSTAFGDYLETHIQRRGLGLQEFCNRVGVTLRAYGKWRTGECYPAMLVTFRICDVLHIRADELVTEAMADAIERDVA